MELLLQNRHAGPPLLKFQLLSLLRSPKLISSCHPRLTNNCHCWRQALPLRIAGRQLRLEQLAGELLLSRLPLLQSGMANLAALLLNKPSLPPLKHLATSKNSFIGKQRRFLSLPFQILYLRLSVLKGAHLELKQQSLLNMPLNISYGGVVATQSTEWRLP